MFGKISEKCVFSKKVGKSKEAMIEFLTSHFRYYTMNSWNRSTSYANKVKIWNVIPKELQNAAFEIMEQGDVYDDINELIREFEILHDWQWQTGFNGRSGGYLVLYRGGKELSGYKTRCDSCRRLTWYEEEQHCHVSGCNGTLKKLTQPHYRTYSQPGKSVDEEVDFADWDISSLKERVELVQEFDKLCDDIVGTFIYYCKSFKVKEEEIMVPKTIKVLEEVIKA